MIYNPRARFNMEWLNDTLSILNDRINALEEIAAEYVAEQEGEEISLQDLKNLGVSDYQLHQMLVAGNGVIPVAKAEPAPEVDKSALRRAFRQGISWAAFEMNDKADAYRILQHFESMNAEAEIA